MGNIKLNKGGLLELNKAYNEDCIGFMNNLPDKCIDLTVTSPPYDNLRTYNDSLEWGEYIWKPILQDLFRITKDGGVVVWVVGDATIKGSETGTSFKQALYAMGCGFNLHDTMIYNRASMPHNAKRYNQDFEYMFIFTKGKIEKFNPIKVKSIYGGTSCSPTTTGKDGDRKPQGKRIVGDTKIKSNLWEYSTGGEQDFHPAVFPMKLAKDHIISWSNKNDTIFDPFMGSFTTAIASYNLQRNWIGCEKVYKYFYDGNKRYKTETLQGLMDF